MGELVVALIIIISTGMVRRAKKRFLCVKFIFLRSTDQIDS
jgi:hypothetical protein